MKNIYGYAKKIVIPQDIIEIPKITDEELLKRYTVLKPLITIEKIPYLIRDFSLEELKTMSYIFNKEDNKIERISRNDLEAIEEFLCLHSYKYKNLFSPKISEILAQSPIEFERQNHLFEIVEQPITNEDFYKYDELLEKGYHLSKVRVYRKR